MILHHFTTNWSTVTRHCLLPHLETNDSLLYHFSTLHLDTFIISSNFYKLQLTFIISNIDSLSRLTPRLYTEQ